VHALAPNTLAAPSSKTIVALCHFCPLAEVDLPPFVDNCHPKMDLVLDREAFISTLTHSPRFSFGGPLGMVYELLWDCFVLDDYANGFDSFFEICKHNIRGHVPSSLSCLLVAMRLLALEK
jgi:hypothetical protein